MSNTIKAQVAASPRASNPAGFDMTIGSGALLLGSPYTIKAQDSVIVNYSGGALTVTLPDASSFTYRQLFFCNVGGGAVTSDATNVIPINGAATSTAILGAAAGKWAHLIAIPPNWQIIGGN